MQVNLDKDELALICVAVEAYARRLEDVLDTLDSDAVRRCVRFKLLAEKLEEKLAKYKS